MSDLRTVYWHEIASQDWLVELRLRCYDYLLRHDATPDEVAAALGADILAVRPRCSELRTGLPRDARNPLVLAVTTGERRGDAHVLRAIPYAEALERWRQRERARPVHENHARGAAGYPTVEAAVSSLTPEEQAALGAKLMGKWAHLHKRQPSAAGAEQMTLLPA